MTVTVLDLIVLGVVVLFVLHGYVRGLLRKVAGIAALVGASVAVGFVAAKAAAYLRTEWGYDSPWVHVGCSVVGWLGLYIVLRLVLGILAGLLLMACGEEVKSWDRKLGAVFGTLQGLVLCWFVVMVMDAFPADKQPAALHRQLQRSLFAGLVRRTSPAARLELQPLIADLVSLTEKPAALDEVHDDPAASGLVRHPKVQHILADRALLHRWQQGDYLGFFDDPKVDAALRDPEVRDLLRDACLRQMLHKQAEKARRGG